MWANVNRTRHVRKFGSYRGMYSRLLRSYARAPNALLKGATLLLLMLLAPFWGSMPAPAQQTGLSPTLATIQRTQTVRLGYRELRPRSHISTRPIDRSATASTYARRSSRRSAPKSAISISTLTTSK